MIIPRILDLKSQGKKRLNGYHSFVKTGSNNCKENKTETRTKENERFLKGEEGTIHT